MCFLIIFATFRKQRFCGKWQHACTPARFSRFGWVCFCKFSVIFRVRFLDGFGNGCLVISGRIWSLFWLPKSVKNVIDFGVDFWNAQKVDYTDWGERPAAQTPRPGYHKWYPSGLQNWSPVPEGNRNGGTEELCRGSDTPWAGGPANLNMGSLLSIHYVIWT